MRTTPKMGLGNKPHHHAENLVLRPAIGKSLMKHPRWKINLTEIILPQKTEEPDGKELGSLCVLGLKLPP